MAKAKAKKKRRKGYTVKTTLPLRARVKSKGFPTIDDVRKQAGPLGLLDPKLRKSVTGRIPTPKEVLGR